MCVVCLRPFSDVWRHWFIAPVRSSLELYEIFQHVTINLFGSEFVRLASFSNALRVRRWRWTKPFLKWARARPGPQLSPGSSAAWTRECERAPFVVRDILHRIPTRTFPFRGAWHGFAPHPHPSSTSNRFRFSKNPLNSWWVSYFLDCIQLQLIPLPFLDKQSQT